MGTGGSPERCISCGGYLFTQDEPPALMCSCQPRATVEPNDEALDPSEIPGYYENNSILEEEEK